MTDSADNAEVQLKVNGRKVPLNPFVQSFICETVAGMVKSLRDVETPQTIELQITRKPD